VSDDLLADRLTGGGKTDWLFAFAFDLATPKKSRAV
jgi:hypothetical protein